MSGRSPRLISVSRGTPLADIAEGELIKLNESGSPVEFYVAKHDYEPDLNGSGRTLLVRKDCHDNCAWRATGALNAYSTSTIDSWLTGTYRSLLDADVIEAIGTTKFMHSVNGERGVTMLERSVFLLSVTEFGIKSSLSNVEGSAVPIAEKLKIAYRNGAAVDQWTRSPNVGTTAYSLYINYVGNLGGVGVSFSKGSRPVFTLPSDFVLTGDML